MIQSTAATTASRATAGRIASFLFISSSIFGIQNRLRALVDPQTCGGLLSGTARGPVGIQVSAVMRMSAHARAMQPESDAQLRAGLVTAGHTCSASMSQGNASLEISSRSPIHLDREVKRRPDKSATRDVSQHPAAGGQQVLSSPAGWTSREAPSSPPDQAETLQRIGCLERELLDYSDGRPFTQASALATSGRSKLPQRLREVLGRSWSGLWWNRSLPPSILHGNRHVKGLCPL